MKEQKAEMRDIKRILDLLKSTDNLWNNGKSYEVNSAIKSAFKYVERVYPSDERLSIEKIIADYNEKCAKALNRRAMAFDYAYSTDAREAFIKNTELFWKAFRDMKKSGQEFLDKPRGKYGRNLRKNLDLFARNAVYYFFTDSKENQLPISTLNNVKDKNEIIISLTRNIKSSLKPGGNPEEKAEILESLRETINQLNAFGYLEKNIDEYNLLMKSVGLNGFAQSDILNEEDGPLSDNALSACSYFQLEALHSFYSNRLTKIEESIGIGLFLISTLSYYDENGKVVFNASDENVKRKWQEYFTFRILLEEKSDDLDSVCAVEEGANGFEKLGGYTTDDIYDVVYAGYANIIESLFEIDEETYKKDVMTFCEATGLSTLNNYRLKNNALEDIIIQANKMKINWGYIPERELRPESSRFVLLGFDVPGLSMPLRLHFPKSDLIEIMKEYIKTNEVPVYVGSEDFRKYARNVGTPLILPIDKKQRDEVKRLANVKDDKISPVVRHIACTQLPNPVAKLLKFSGEVKGKYPDYINLETGKIRRNTIEPSMPG